MLEEGTKRLKELDMLEWIYILSIAGRCSKRWFFTRKLRGYTILKIIRFSLRRGILLLLKSLGFSPL